LKVKILKDVNKSLYITKHISNVSKRLTENDKKKIRNLLERFVNEIISTDNVNVDLFIELIELSPRPDDSSLLNDLIRNAFILKSYKEDFDEEIVFPIEQYYQELIRQ